MLALYAYAFGSYGSALLVGSDVPWIHKSLSVVVIVLFMLINLVGAFFTGKAEDIMVFAKLFILIIFAGVGTLTIDMNQMATTQWMPMNSVITGGLIIFLAFEGFELIANTAKDIENPEKNLPRAYYSSVIFVIILYVWIAMVTVGNLSFEEAKISQDYVLAKAAEPFFGEIGFIIIGIAALLSTASAINATLYGSGRTSYLIAKHGELPHSFEKQIKSGYEGMIIIALLSIIFTTLFDINNISVAGSIGFLIVFTLVNYANLKLYKETKANRLIAGIGALLGLIATIVLITYNLIHSPKSLITSAIVLSVVILFSFIYYMIRKDKNL